jgi:hypothetical protein
MSDHVLGNLNAMPQRQQRFFNAVLAKLRADTHWADTDFDLVDNEDFEISAVLWTFKLGPRGLAKAWDAGKSTLAALIDEEEEWVMDNLVSTEAEYRGRKQLLVDFAEGICDGGCGFRAADAGGEE